MGSIPTSFLPVQTGRETMSSKEHTSNDWWYSNETTVEQGDSVVLPDGRSGVVQSMWKTSDVSFAASAGRSEGSCDVWMVQVKLASGGVEELREEDVSLDAGGSL